MAGSPHSGPFKRCTACDAELPATTEFFQANKGGKYGLRGQCIGCRRARSRELIRQPKNAERRRAASAEYVTSGRRAAQRRAWRKANPESELRSKQKWQAQNRDKTRAAERRRRAANPEHFREKQRRADAKLQDSPQHVLKKRVKARLRRMLRDQSPAMDRLLGYSAADLARHIERQFTDGMTWEALMRGEIHIDHVLPVSSFAISGADCPEFRACWALSNLQPLWAADNLKKQAQILTLL